MRYISFTIKNYRAITGPLTIDLNKKSLLPIIGINESGKTTILQAIFSFDSYNDGLNGGLHLRNTSNLYSTSSLPPLIEAQIEMKDDAEIHEILVELSEEHKSNETLKSLLDKLKRKRRKLPNKLTIQRNLQTLEYTVLTAPYNHVETASILPEKILSSAPYILFFDDFRDKIEEKIIIDPTKKAERTGWLAILEQLFSRTDQKLSVFDLPNMEERKRKSALAKVTRHLNKTLTEEWQNFRLDDREALEISIDMQKESLKPSGTAAIVETYCLKLNVVERDSNGDEHYFFISDRSKGFFWFFNFVMKLEFNPKVLSAQDLSTIYLLDEPGSYLHAFAQSKLCNKLRSLSGNSRVVYCTHSHYLLNPEVIPLSSIHVADKDGNGNITLASIHEHRGNIFERRSAFQPVLDALQIKPFLLDFSHSRTIIVEGMCDYYAMELFRQNRPVGILPSVGAESVKFYVSLMIAWQINFRALWDNDNAGRKARGDAENHFGSEVAGKSFYLLPGSQASKRIMQDLFDPQDLRLFREELGIPDSSFEKTVAATFYSPRKGELIARASQTTRANFDELYRSLNLE
jgi:ABC-type cobalamin/Fe3+-siderophores transport system ATPase subunit